jgi:hypothetical protein
LNLFRQISGLKKAEIEGPEIKLEWSWDTDLRPQVLRLCLDKGLVVKEMRPLAADIEDLYLRIVSGGMEQ